MNQITLYSKSECLGCLATDIALTEKGVEFSVLKMDEDQEALTFVKELGYMSAPVVVVYNEGRVVDSWSGFKPEKIEEL